jgi:hypothetical protein
MRDQATGQPDVLSLALAEPTRHVPYRWNGHGVRPADGGGRAHAHVEWHPVPQHGPAEGPQLTRSR